MTLIVFIVDNGVSMNQRTYQGTTLLDSAKTFIETFFKMRVNKYRSDRYFVFTLNPPPYHMKLAGWRQSSDMQRLHIALSRIKCDGTSSIGSAIGNAFRLLNLNRMQMDLENYGMGMYMSYVEPAVVIVITNINIYFHDVDTGASSIPGGDLTAGLHRWDYRVYAVLLQNPGAIDSLFDLPRPFSLDPSSPIYFAAKRTGGDVFGLSDLRAVPQCIESLANKCQPGVIIDVVDDSDEERIICKQLVHVKIVGRVGSSWPIPENFWPNDELLLSKLPPRPTNPIINIYPSRDKPPKFPEYFPIDRYELEPSLITQKIIGDGDPSMIWPCFVKGSGQKSDSPFGYLKATADSQIVHLHVLPYNYPALANILADLKEMYDMRMTETWGLKFMNYLSSIPRYYFSPLSKAFERLGFHGVIKTESLDRTLPYQLKHHLQKLRHSAKAEYDQLVHIVETADLPPNLIKIPQATLLPSMWQFSELRALDTSVKPQGKLLYEQPCCIPRLKLRKMLSKLRKNLDSILDGVGRPMDREDIHNQNLSEMGDYINYKFSKPQASPLRELTPSPERLDTFGNPFRRKSSAVFIADEVFVDDIGLSGPSCSPNASAITVSTRRRSGLSHVNQSGRAKGPLPPYITYATWRRWSRSNSSISSSPQRDEFSPCPSPIPNFESSHNASPVTCLSPPNEIWRDHIDLKKQKAAFSEDKLAFDTNQKIVTSLIEIVRNPGLDGDQIFNLLTSLVGNLNQRYACISFVMAESLRFKQMELYKLLEEWRSCLSSSNINNDNSTVRNIPVNNSPSEVVFVNGIS